MAWGRIGFTALLLTGALVLSGENQPAHAQEPGCQAKLLELYRTGDAGTLGELESRLKACEDYAWGFCQAAKPTSKTTSKNSWPRITFQDIDACRFNRITEWTTYNKTERTRFFCEWDQFSGTYLKKLVTYQKSLGEGPDARVRNLENAVPAKLGAELFDLRQIMDTRKFEWSETRSRTKKIENRISKVLERPDCPPEEIEEAKKKIPKKRRSVTTYPGGKKGGGQNKPVAEDPPADNPENETAVAEEQPDFDKLFRRFSIDGGFGYVHSWLPDYKLGVVSRGTNLNPLHDLTPRADGFGLDFGVKFELPGPGVSDTSWGGRIGGGFSKTDGSETETIGGFAPGQLPTYFDLTGVGGFAYNRNSMTKVDVDATRFSANGEFGFKKAFPNGLTVNPYAGAFYRHSRIDYDVNLNTDFAGGTFFNTLNERLRLNQFGADLGFDLTYRFNPGLFLTLGGHAGLAYTDASYTGRDCGDGSTATPGCDGTLFANGGVSRGRQSVDPFAGLKAVVGAYIFCKQYKVEIAAAALNAAASALRNSCVQVKAEGRYAVMPGIAIDRPTMLGGPSVGLSGDHSQSISLRGEATIPF